MESFSMNVIAQSLSSQCEMIAPGVMGINFMKPQKPINTASDVYRLVQEEEQNKVKSPSPGSGPGAPFRQSKIPPTMAPKPVAAPAPLKTPTPAPVKAPAPAPAPKPKSPVPPPQEHPSQGPCTDCGRNIVGPFVGLTDRTLHEECFKCSTCGSSLKNVGFHNINNKLYCETHATLAARITAAPAGPAYAAPAEMAAAPAPSVPFPAAPAPIPAPPFPFPAAPVAFSAAPAPIPTLSPVAAMSAPKFPSSLPQPCPTPFGQHVTAHLPQTPSSSGSLTFRSISPQPFKRMSGEYHRVEAPKSPTPGSSPSSLQTYSTGPLPFEMKPYMPPDQTRSALFCEMSQSSEISQTSQTSQVIQRTTKVSQQVAFSSQSQHITEYSQVGGQTKKFVWPPQRAEGEGEQASAPSQNYSPLVSQLPSDQSVSGSTLLSVQPPSQQETRVQQEAQQETRVQQEMQVQKETHVQQEIKVQHEMPGGFVVPPLPTSFPPREAPAVEKIIGVEPRREGGQAPNFAPVLEPVVDRQSAPSSGPPPAGVPTGAGSRPAPRKGRGQFMQEQVPGRAVAICGNCGDPIRGPFVIALNRTWCPDHFHCNNTHCRRPLLDVGFVEEQGQLYCETCYELFLAPICASCQQRVKGDCLNALDKQWHPECFTCGYCHKPFGNNSFYLEDGLPYCEKDWNELFTTKCVSCGFAIEAGDRWVEALNNNYHSQCFKCSSCQKNLEGQSFYAKGGKPYCKQHAR